MSMSHVREYWYANEWARGIGVEWCRGGIDRCRASVDRGWSLDW